MYVQGSAAASRGASSSSSADKIAKFLVEMASTGKSFLPFTPEDGDHLDLSKFDEISSLQLQITAASAYGSMLFVDLKPLMKQRLTHTSLKFIRSKYEEERDHAMTGQTIKAPQIGLLVIVCHVICCNDISKLDQSTQHLLATLGTEGLSSAVFLNSGNAKSFVSNNSALKNLVLAAILKLICVAPSSVPVSLTAPINILSLDRPTLNSYFFFLTVEWVFIDISYGAVACVCSIRPVFRSILQAFGVTGFGRSGPDGRCKSACNYRTACGCRGFGCSNESPFRGTKTSSSRCTECMVCVGLGRLMTTIASAA